MLKQALQHITKQKTLTVPSGFSFAEKEGLPSVFPQTPYCKCNFQSFQDSHLKIKNPTQVNLVGFYFQAVPKLRLIAEKEGFEPPEV